MIAWLASPRARPLILFLWFPLALAVLAAGVAVSRQLLPAPFDWRYQMISALTNEKRNPDGGIYLSLAFSVTFAMMLPVAAYMRVRVPAGPLSSRAFYAMSVGCAATVLQGIDRGCFQYLWPDGWKGHELLSVAGFLLSALGIVGFWYAHAMQRREAWALSRATTGVLATVAAAPFLGAGLSQLWLYLVPNELGWVGPHWAGLGVPVWLSLAFWEWLTIVVGFAYWYVLVALLPAAAIQRGLQNVGERPLALHEEGVPEHAQHR